MTVPTLAVGRPSRWLRQPKKAAIVVLDAATGKELRQHPLRAEGTDPTRAGLPVLHGKVFCSEGGEEPSVTAFDTKTGEVAWRTGLGKDDGACPICPVAAGNKVFVATRTTHAGKKST